MMRYALIKDGAVVNVVEANSDWRPPPDFSAVLTQTAGPGWTYDGVNFAAPPRPPLTAEQQAALDDMAAGQVRRELMDAQPDQADLLARIKTATPAQIDSWLSANVTNLAQARAVLGAIMKYLAR